MLRADAARPTEASGYRRREADTPAFRLTATGDPQDRAWLDTGPSALYADIHGQDV